MSRIVGKLGALYLDDFGVTTGLVKVADIYDWTLDFEIDWDECGVKGTNTEDYSAGVVTGTVRAQRFLTDSATDPAAGPALLRTLTSQATTYVKSVTAGAKILYKLENIDGAPFTAANEITGSGVVRRSTMNNPRAMANESIEIMLTSIPVVA